jgi:DNA polymerase IIIc chi subunit
LDRDRHTWDTSLEQFLPTKLVQDNQQYMVQGCILLSWNDHQGNKQPQAQSFLIEVVRKFELGMHGTSAKQNTDILGVFIGVCWL